MFGFLLADHSVTYASTVQMRCRWIQPVIVASSTYLYPFWTDPENTTSMCILAAAHFTSIN